ncbi:uncharacterized protein HRG_08404 [Hirsutella rhossiliensis]|uniref:Uncharacterized protein n=1 Tax=Hirsutella rhossiliensis TaxID=111463 RepID=A0A9P8MSB4_9HYPO|nr:uncharacterized protein HRG_08404 [Hirsutella rhossiliensis]KAH0960249.1 hypothetical protein HRG_08404 [Hirsutella rhossiliensis]
MATTPSDELSFAAAAEKGSSAATTTARASPPPPSPRTVLLRRVSAMMRVLAVPAPLPVLFYDALWLADTCNALAALLWNIAVAMSVIRTLRGRRAIPYTLHVGLAALIALSATACFAILVFRLVYHRLMSRGSAATLVCFMATAV